MSGFEVTPAIRAILFRVGRVVDVTPATAHNHDLSPSGCRELITAGLATKERQGMRLTLEGYEIAEREAQTLKDQNHPGWQIIHGEIRRNWIIAQRRAGINVEYETPQRDEIQAPRWMTPGSDEDEAIINAVRELPLIQRHESPDNIRDHVHAIIKIVKLSA